MTEREPLVDCLRRLNRRGSQRPKTSSCTSSLDRAYLERQARELGLAGLLDDLLSGRIGPKTT